MQAELKKLESYNEKAILKEFDKCKDIILLQILRLNGVNFALYLKDKQNEPEAEMEGE